MTLGDLLLRMCEVCCWGKKCLSMENLHTVVREFYLILLEKETGKKFWWINNKTRIGIGHQHECWMELKEFINVNSAIVDVVRKLGNWDMHN
jgi:hypothetical protein